MKQKLRLIRAKVEIAAYSCIGFFWRMGNRSVKPRVYPNYQNGSWGNVAVIGRATSALAFTTATDAYDIVILCNFEKTDLANMEFLSALSNARAIFMLGASSEPMVSLSIARKLPIAEVIWLGFFDGRLPSRVRQRGKLSKLGLPVRGLPNDFPTKWLNSFPKNTGLSAIRLASLRASEISIFGIEFYQTAHIFATAEDRGGFGMNRADFGPAIRESFEDLLKQSRNVNFKIYGEALGLKSQPNLTVISI